MQRKLSTGSVLTVLTAVVQPRNLWEHTQDLPTQPGQAGIRGGAEEPDTLKIFLDKEKDWIE